MLSIQADTSKITKRFHHMWWQIRQMQRHGMRQTLDDFQTEDMHRKKPFTLAWKRGKVRMVAHPHSLIETTRSFKFGKRERSRAKRRKHYMVSAAYLHRSTRPILRPVLDEAVRERFRNLLRTIHW